MEKLRKKGFDIRDDYIKKLQMDFEQSAAIPNEVRLIVETYEKAINQDQQPPRQIDNVPKKVYNIYA